MESPLDERRLPIFGLSCGGARLSEYRGGSQFAIMNWKRRLRFNAVSSLTSSGNKAVVYFVKRDLLGRKASPLREIWDLPEVRKLLARQQHDGRWRWTGSRPALFPPHHHDLIETFERFRELVMYYELSRAHPAIERAAEFLFSCQTDSGDIRGMLGNQHATYYTGEILALLIKAGYAVDARVEKGMRWLRAIRQDDGGWNTPLLTHRLSRAEQYRLTSTDAQPLPPDRTRPSQGATYAERLTRPTVLVVFRVCHS
ncbi:MAG: hypothetical protein JXO72_00760 [Vicinamibacteria bacterium]|nr:hypothetical protein [Vicinamibacteria bacterium]